MDTKFFNVCIQKIPIDVNALVPIYEEYYQRIIVHVSYKFSQQIAEDVAQSFFVDLMQSKENREYIKYPTSWIFKSCDHIAMRKLRYESRFAELKEDFIAQDMFDSVSIDHDFKEEIKKLDDISQRILFYFYWEGYSQEEIAVMMDRKPATIRQKHHRALKKLRKYL